MEPEKIANLLAPAFNRCTGQIRPLLVLLVQILQRLEKLDQKKVDECLDEIEFQLLHAEAIDHEIVRKSPEFDEGFRASCKAMKQALSSSRNDHQSGP